ncbi:hypothetical protein NDU88_007904 [Pleurodeles waltl]|uniref:Uncharacterized protein n=1 Tax=Pleurodeles waltl TaxID=8319 RepID=A0AAV7NYQ9_PLEWA|nr:hypothetical protein NDU88_007904 [Pleurodeles waltl]
MPNDILVLEKPVMKDIKTLSGKRKYVKYNLTFDEYIAINSLKKTSEIIIKAADKSGDMVIQDISDYRNEILTQLNDE